MTLSPFEMIATAEIIERTWSALTSLEGDDRDSALASLTDLVCDAVLDRELVVSALDERLKYCERRVRDASEPETRERWAVQADRLRSELMKVRL